MTIARVRWVTAASISSALMLSVSGRMSTNTGMAPLSANAFAVETKVKDGMITSSPGFRSHRSAAISSAAVHDGVISTRRVPRRPSR